MKKLFYLVFVLCFGVILAGCSGTPKAEDIKPEQMEENLVNIAEKTTTMDSFTFSVKGNFNYSMKLDLSGMPEMEGMEIPSSLSTIEMKMEIDATVKYTKEYCYVEASISGEVPNEEGKLEKMDTIKYEGYTALLDDCVIMATRETEGKETSEWYVSVLTDEIPGDLSDLGSLKDELGEEELAQFNSLISLFKKSGNKYFIDKDSIKKFVEDNADIIDDDLVSGMMNIDAMLDSLKINDCYFTVKDNALDTVKVDIAANVKEEGTTVKFDLNLDGSLKAIGSTTVTLPQDVKDQMDKEKDNSLLSNAGYTIIGELRNEATGNGIASESTAYVGLKGGYIYSSDEKATLFNETNKDEQIDIDDFADLAVEGTVTCTYSPSYGMCTFESSEDFKIKGYECTIYGIGTFDID